MLSCACIFSQGTPSALNFYMYNGFKKHKGYKNMYIHVYVPPDKRKTLSTPFCTNTVAARGAIRSLSSYRMMIWPGLLVCAKCS